MQCRRVAVSVSRASSRRCHAKLPSAAKQAASGKVNKGTSVSSLCPFTHSQYIIAATAMSTSRTPFVCASCTRTLRATVKPNTVRSFSTTLAKTANSFVPSHDEPRWKQTPPQMKMPFRLRPQPNQPVWKVNEDVQLVDQAFDKFVGQTGGKGARGSELLPEEIKVRLEASVSIPSTNHQKRV
jgi:hypothetical protein